MPVALVRSPQYELALEKANGSNPNLDEVLQLLQVAVEKGDERAKYALGNWYLHGKNVQKDVEIAFQLIRSAANLKHPDALYDMAIFYEKGVVVKEDLRTAFKFYLDGALHGNAQAHYEVGRFIWYGMVGEADEDIGEIWLSRAKELGVEDDDD